MHQPVTAPDRAKAAPAWTTLRSADRSFRVPLWWADAHGYRHGQTLMAEDAPAARLAGAIAYLATRRVRKRAMDPHIPPEARAKPPVLDAHPSRATAADRRWRAGLLLLSTAVSATIVIAIIRGIFA